MKSGEPVYVKSMRPSRTDKRVLHVEFCQEIPQSMKDRSALLNLLMEGHEAFSPTSRTRVAYQNIFSDVYAKFGLDIGTAFPKELGAEIVVHEFCEGDTIPESIRSFYDNVEKFTPASWLSWDEGEPVRVHQQPKKTPYVEGKGQTVLTRNGAPIYRNTFFTLGGMDQNDYLIKHDDIHQQGAFTSNLLPKKVVGQIGNSRPT
jgi:hypothetical protein